MITNKTDKINQEISGIDNLGDNVHNLIHSLVDQETGQRGYTLTGDKQFLQPYRIGTKMYSIQSKELKSIIRRYPTLAGPVNTMIAKGFYWHDQYGANQVKAQEHGSHVELKSFYAGKAGFDEFRNSSQLALDKISSYKKERLKHIKTLTFRYHLMLIIFSIILFGTLLLLMLRTFQQVTEPILEIRSAILEMAKGNFDYPLPYNRKSKNELSDLVSSLNVMRYQLHNTLNRTKQIAETDSLTGIYNRGFFDLELNKLIDNFCLGGKPFSLIFIDIDHFKLINDMYGHTEGDRILCFVTGLISKHIRETDIFARYGGEEFAVLTSSADAVSFAERLRNIIDHTPFGEYHITASFGISTFLKDDDAKSFIDRADQAMYRAKSMGRNRVAVSTFCSRDIEITKRVYGNDGRKCVSS